MGFKLESDLSNERTLFPVNGYRERRVRPDLPDLATGIGRVALVYDSASPAELAAGHNWYWAAHQISRDMAERYDLDIDVAAGIIAALSPRTSWEENLRRAERLVKHGDVRGLGYTVEDAKRIYQGESVEEVLYHKSRFNFKVRAFFENIRDPDGSRNVTIDRYMWAVLFDQLGVADELLKFSEEEFSFAIGAFQKLALIMGVRPHELQATVWIVWKRMYHDKHLAQYHQPSFF